MNGATTTLTRTDAGKALIPDLQRRRRGRWHPEDLIEPLAGQDSAWRQARWQGAQDYLAQAGIDGATIAGARLDAGAVNS